MTIHPAYQTLLQELPAMTIVWADSKRIFTARDMGKEVANSTETALQWAQQLLSKALAFTREKQPDWTPPQQWLTLDVTPREHLVSAVQALPTQQLLWKTASRRFQAGELAQLMQDRDPEGLQYATNALRAARDLEGRKAAIRAEEGALA